MSKKLAWLLGGLSVLVAIAPIQASEDTISDRGVNVRPLHEAPYNLIGRKIGLGQVEVGRPGKFGLDKAASNNRSLSLAGVFLRDRQALADTDVDGHAAMVAMVMISGDKRVPGVAPGARLYSSAVGSLQDAGQPEECLASQHVALQNTGDVRAINFSFGEPLRRDPRPNPVLDGNALLTRCVDWSARVHNVLYVIAGNQGGGGIPIPTDNYNGVNVAASTMREGIFDKVDFSNLSSLPEGIGRSLILREINTGGRRAINLVAPGSHVAVRDLDGTLEEVRGTSFAAPHVAGAIGVLQEFGDRQLAKAAPNWSLDSRRSEVMKAVLLNSADKVQDAALGVDRTLFDKNNQTWLEGDAYQNPEIPLDIQTGTGHLNVYRAYQQFSGGQNSPDTPVLPRGWDYNTVKVGSYQDYAIASPLQRGNFASVTLTWHRQVELNDDNGNNLFDVGENFQDLGLNDLNVYLLPADSNNTATAVCSSISKVDSSEHIFCPVPSTGRYKIRVVHRQQVNDPLQAYGLAWWTIPAQ
ncbi:MULTISPECIES: S8 family serine peptidase [Spirulina sp. CCY15215]|uniref:S8 family serine peptidase n=1 Tax=Spirulina sp. CCY15215 TaxID=2767591 RepID=UPI00195141B4|nr:S8 family serine peptidase [Spirulina major]